MNNNQPEFHLQEFHSPQEQYFALGSEYYGSNQGSKLRPVGFLKSPEFTSNSFLQDLSSATVPLAGPSLYEQQSNFSYPSYPRNGNYLPRQMNGSPIPIPGQILPNQNPPQRTFQSRQTPNTGGSDAQGRALNKMLLDILKEKNLDPHKLSLAVDANIERMDCVNLATLLFHTAKKRLMLTPSFIKRIAVRFAVLKEELRAREASNALYGLKCMSSESVEVRQLLLSLANKISVSSSELVAQAVGNALYGCQNLTSDHEEVRYLMQILAVKVAQCTEPLEAQNVGNALYGLRGMNSDFKEVRALISSLTMKIATAREELNGQALGNSLYGLQCMSSKEPEVRGLLVVLSEKTTRTWEDLKAQEVGNALYGLKRMSSDVAEVRLLINALVPKICQSPEILDAQAIGNSFYGMQNMRSDNSSVLALLATMAEKVSLSRAELNGQAMGNSLYGMQGMSSEHAEVRAVVNSLTMKLQQSSLEMNAQELGNALYGLQNMTTDFPEVRKLIVALSQKVAMSKHDLTSQEIGNALFGLQCMKSESWETRLLLRHMAQKISLSHSVVDPQGIANSLYGMQKLSSECNEVKMLSQALSLKIDQSWKLLGAQHIANSLFGLQYLTNTDPEVTQLLRSLVPKLSSCRDEMSPRQFSCSLFGLQNMYSSGEEVRALVGLLSEKVKSCPDNISGTSLSVSLFGLQGMDDSSIEVRSLLSALAEKSNRILEMDGVALGNAFYGLQRMNGQNDECRELLEGLYRFLALANDFGMGVSLSAPVCARIIYGLQHFHCSEEVVRNILRIAVNRVKELTLGYLSETSLGVGMTQRPTSLCDVLQLYQAISLSLLNLPELEVDIELRDGLLEQQSLLTTVVEARKLEYQPNAFTVTQTRLLEAISSILKDEPFTVTSELIFGFESSVLVQLKAGIHLTTAAGSLWNPEVDFQVIGSSRNFPAVDLFVRLRNRFLSEQKAVFIQEVPVTLLAGQYQTCQTIEKAIKSREGFLTPLFPPSIDDANEFTSILSSMGLTGPRGLLASIFEESSSGNPQSYRASLGIIGIEPSVRRVEPLGIDDYSDDDYDGGICRIQKGSRSLYQPNTITLWIGEYPTTHGPRGGGERDRNSGYSASLPSSPSVDGIEFNSGKGIHFMNPQIPPNQSPSTNQFVSSPFNTNMNPSFNSSPRFRPLPSPSLDNSFIGMNLNLNGAESNRSQTLLSLSNPSSLPHLRGSIPEDPSTVSSSVYSPSTMRWGGNTPPPPPPQQQQQAIHSSSSTSPYQMSHKEFGINYSQQIPPPTAHSLSYSSPSLQSEYHHHPSSFPMSSPILAPPFIPSSSVSSSTIISSTSSSLSTPSPTIPHSSSLLSHSKGTMISFSDLYSPSSNHLLSNSTSSSSSPSFPSHLSIPPSSTTLMTSLSLNSIPHPQSHSLLISPLISPGKHSFQTPTLSSSSVSSSTSNFFKNSILESNLNDFPESNFSSSSSSSPYSTYTTEENNHATIMNRLNNPSQQTLPWEKIQQQTQLLQSQEQNSPSSVTNSLNLSFLGQKKDQDVHLLTQQYNNNNNNGNDNGEIIYNQQLYERHDLDEASSTTTLEGRNVDEGERDSKEKTPLGSEVDNEIALLQAQLEIRRIETQMLMLKMKKEKSSSVPTSETM